jgi:hypothetical protein
LETIGTDVGAVTLEQVVLSEDRSAATGEVAQ